MGTITSSTLGSTGRATSRAGTVGARVSIVVVRTDPEKGGTEGLSAIMVERGTPGVSYKLISKIGHRLTPNAEITFERTLAYRPPTSWRADPLTMAARANDTRSGPSDAASRSLEPLDPHPRIMDARALTVGGAFTDAARLPVRA
jgi:hypothetical protein